MQQVGLVWDDRAFSSLIKPPLGRGHSGDLLTDTSSLHMGFCQHWDGLRISTGRRGSCSLEGHRLGPVPPALLTFCAEFIGKTVLYRKRSRTK